METSGFCDCSICNAFQTLDRMISPMWWRHGHQRSCCPKLSCTDIQAVDKWPVLADVVSKTITLIFSAQFHWSSNSRARLESFSPHSKI